MIYTVNVSRTIIPNKNKKKKKKKKKNVAGIYLYRAAFATQCR